MALLTTTLLAFAGTASAGFLTNGLAITPQMGWDNWNAFACDVSETLLLGTAQRMVELGLKDAGYQYVVLDDCWSDGRYPNGTLKPDFTKFPNGMKHVADAVHALGMKFGMYSDAGAYTCGQYGECEPFFALTNSVAADCFVERVIHRLEDERKWIDLY